MSGYGILENLLSDFLFVLILVFFGWLIHLVTGRKRLVRFFGIDSSRRLVVYLSNLRVKPFGAIGIDGVERSYRGITVAYGEMTIANRFRDLFNYLLPSVSENPGFLSKLLISDVQVKLIHSPVRDGDIENLGSFISLGSPAFNAASSLVEKRLGSKVCFTLGVIRQVDSAPVPTVPEVTSLSTQGTTVMVIPSGDSSGSYPFSDAIGTNESIPQEIHPSIHVEGIPPITDNLYGFIERVIDKENKRSVFYVAGLSEHSTTGAGFYLLTEWSRLCKKFGYETPFLVMLRFEPGNLENWTLVFEK